jgi:SAM-dependent methyltransferase
MTAVGTSILLPLSLKQRRLDNLLLRPGAVPGYCRICGHLTVFRIADPNFRESCVCHRCRSFSRQRQIAHVVLGGVGKPRPSSMRALASSTDLAIYNTEANRAFHEVLKSMPRYHSSEYLGSGHHSGDIIEGVMHQDLENLSFQDASLDLIISGDVFEHIPDPYQAHRELFRVLRPGGRHVFTVPFIPAALHDDVRARRSGEGDPDLLADPIYHLDPMDPKGALVYTIFGIEMLVKLEEIGFDPRLHLLHNPWYGILGSHGLVFEAIRPT